MLWHQKTTEQALNDLGSDFSGLSPEEAALRLERYGPNELKEAKKKTAFMMFLDQFKDFMIMVLIAAAVISGAIGEVSDTVAIVVILILNAIIGFVQEYRAEKAMEALKKLASASAVAIRGGTPVQLPAADLVPGDVVSLEAGNVVPADLRLSEAARLQVEEAALTGESVPVEKHTKALPDESVSLGDRKNMAFKGTVVTYGRGLGIVTSTGMETELGKIAAMLQGESEVKTPLQKRLAIFGKKLALVVLVICAVVFAFGVLRGEPPLIMLLTAISLAVAAIPEALPAVVTISLALGAKKMIERNALIRKLPAVETLGSVTYICSDKTGTLTLNKMTVEEMFSDMKLLTGPELSAPSESDNRVFATMLRAMALSNDATACVDGSCLGDPTEVALYMAAKDRGLEKKALEATFPRVAEVPFDSERKCMTTFHRRPDGGFVSFTKGAVDVLLVRARDMLTSEGLKRIDRQDIERISDRMAADGLRIICIAMREWADIPKDMTHPDVEGELTFLGLAGLMDPPREEAREAVALCKTAGIIPVMITGDHPLTARTIARRLGILGDDESQLISGRELEAMSLEEFEKRVEHIRVYARVAPEQKLKIVKALQDRGQYVAMTGDGVNDAPALKRADIGVAMGITGTDVSKEASHMVLLDDNFATIVKAVREGRKIYDNIRKFIKYLLTTNSGEIWTLFLAPFAGLPIPLLPIHILWINLMTDGLPALALSVEPAEGDLMKRPPRRPDESIFAHGLGIHAIWVGLLMGVTVLSAQAWSIHTGNAHWQTMVFTVLCLTQLGHVLAIRSETQSLFTMGITTNKALLAAVLFSFAAQMATIYVPLFNSIFKTEPLSAGELTATLALSSVVLFAVEIEKLIKRRKSQPY